MPYECKIEGISELTSIRRAADLEKKLLEQVQGIEVKLKLIKSKGEQYAERKLLGKSKTVRLPPLAKSSSTSSSLDFHKGTLRSLKPQLSDRL